MSVQRAKFFSFLEKRTKEHVTGINKCLELIRGNQFDVLGQVIQPKIVGSKINLSDRQWIRFKLSWGEIDIGISQSGLLELCYFWFAELRDEDLSKTPTSWLVHLLMQQILSNSELLEIFTDYEVLDNTHASLSDFSVEFEFAGKNLDAAVCIQTIEKTKMTSASFLRSSKSIEIASVPLLVRVLSSPVSVALKDLRSLRLNEAICIATAKPNAVPVKVEFGGHDFFDATLTAEGIKLMNELQAEELKQPIYEDDTEKNLDSRMLDTSLDQGEVNEEVENYIPEEHQNPHVDLDRFSALSLEVTLVVAKRNMSLGEIAQVGVGSVLEMGEPLDDNVEILANGSLLGNGKLFSVEDTIAVQVTQWAPKAMSA